MQIKVDRAIFSELEAYADRVYPRTPKKLADPSELIMAATHRAIYGKPLQNINKKQFLDVYKHV
jgi:hypothetical protein